MNILTNISIFYRASLISKMCRYFLNGPLKISSTVSDNVFFENDILPLLKKHDRQLNTFGLKLDLKLKSGAVYQYGIPLATSIAIQKNKNQDDEKSVFLHLMLKTTTNSNTISEPKHSFHLEFATFIEKFKPWLEIPDSYYETIQNSLGLLLFAILSSIIFWVNKKLNNFNTEKGSARTDNAANAPWRCPPDGHVVKQLQPL